MENCWTGPYCKTISINLNITPKTQTHTQPNRKSTLSSFMLNVKYKLYTYISIGISIACICISCSKIKGKKKKIAQQNHTKNITKKPFYCDSYILKIITRHSLINTHLTYIDIDIYVLMYPLVLYMNITRLYNSAFEKHLAKNSFYLCNYARVSERSARRDFLSFKKSCTSNVYGYLCVLYAYCMYTYIIEVKQQNSWVRGWGW